MTSVNEMNPLKSSYSAVQLILKLHPELAKNLFKNMGDWAISPTMYERMVNLIKTSEHYKTFEKDNGMIEALSDMGFQNIEGRIKKEEVDQLFENVIYQMGIMIAMCHMANVEDHSHIAEEMKLDVKWVLVVHENETGSIFDNDTKAGRIIDIIPNYHLTTADGCVVLYDTSNDVFQHMIVFGTQSAPSFT